MVRGQDLLTFVVYDIESDRVRSRVANVCKDYGLSRIQYSAFSGLLDSSRRQELFLKLSDTLGRRSGRILVLPVCERDAGAKRQILNESASGETPDV
jgi:CRISPR-associated protein Cas2